MDNVWQNAKVAELEAFSDVRPISQIPPNDYWISRSRNAWVLLAFQDGDCMILTVPGWRHYKIWLSTDVNGVLVASFYPDCLSEHLEVLTELFEVQFSWPPATQNLETVHKDERNVNLNCSSEEMKYKISALKRGKASGPDRLNPALFKGGEYLMIYLAKQIGAIRYKEKVPTEWVTSTIIFVFKKRTRTLLGLNPTSPVLGQPGSIPALVLPSGGMAAKHRKMIQLNDYQLPSVTKRLDLTVLVNPPVWGLEHGVRWLKWLEREFTDLNVRGTNLAVSQPSCFLRVAWRLGTDRVLQLNDLSFIYLEHTFESKALVEDPSSSTFPSELTQLPKYVRLPTTSGDSPSMVRDMFNDCMSWSMTLHFEFSARTSKSRIKFANLRHLWRLHVPGYSKGCVVIWVRDVATESRCDASSDFRPPMPQKRCCFWMTPAD
ncbi:LOW QUALITY PROTEIN: hypothetical protein T265_15430 [Opisthorchis viverrini]|uniref:Uncharacterized protein n=1 Tax=Opisthorchis viverrini TaxID=6198 RepID=A0A074ZXJ4_OPIVI|nr:LOW QUALITY PROTEIN: hypothetical protein T265_15430 [Opisthorchis viverrini]KER19929.1 LOW QUALITY PROTEIN: hypothetical protein T265_15430 [Opisthorchis viverrini]